MQRFVVHAAGRLIDRDQGFEALVLAQDPDSADEPRIEIQRSFNHDEQDRRLGQDTHCVVTESQATSYGAIAEWGLDGRTLRIRLTPKGEADLGVDDGFELVLDDSVDIGAVRSALEMIVGRPLGDVWKSI